MRHLVLKTARRRCSAALTSLSPPRREVHSSAQPLPQQPQNNPLPSASMPHTRFPPPPTPTPPSYFPAQSALPRRVAPARQQVLFHHASSPPLTWYILILADPSSASPLLVQPSLLSTRKYQRLQSSPHLLSVITVDWTATGIDLLRYPHPAVYLSITTAGQLLCDRQRRRWPQPALDDIVTEVMQRWDGPEQAGEGSRQEAEEYLRYMLHWTRQWGKNATFLPAASQRSVLYSSRRLGWTPFDPRRLLLGAVLAVAAFYALRAEWQRRHPRPPPPPPATPKKRKRRKKQAAEADAQAV